MELEHFFKRFGGFAPEHDWEHMVRTSKEGLKGLFGKDVIDYVQTRVSAQAYPTDVEHQDIASIINEINREIPLNVHGRLHSKYGVDLYALLARGKFLDKYGRVNKSAKSFLSVLGDGYPQSIDKNLSRLGKLWTSFSPISFDVKVRITADPLSFAMLGEYGDADSDSCFRQGGEREKDKYRLGQTTDSFVVLINSIHNDEWSLPNARMWGVYEEKQETIHLSNFYCDETINVSDGEIACLMTKVFKELSEERFNNVFYNRFDSDDSDDLYVNPNPVSFSCRKSIERCYLKVDTFMLERAFAHCEMCEEPIDTEDEAYSIGDFFYCSGCAEEAHYCEFCGHVSFNDVEFEMVTVSLHPPHREELVCDHCIEKDCYRCDDCEELFHENLVTNFEGNAYCHDCYESLPLESEEA